MLAITIVIHVHLISQVPGIVCGMIIIFLQFIPNALS